MAATSGRASAAKLPRTAISGGAVVDDLQARRIIRLTERGLRLGFRVFARKDQRWSECAAAAAGEGGQSIERGARPAKMVDQIAKGARRDVFRADQAQPIDRASVRRSA
jgi:hypothetical protein